jgi:hypothetical protein
MSADTNPLRGKIVNASATMAMLHRFTKPGDHWAEIRERTVTQFNAIEFIVFVNGSLLESQLFHNGREVEYPAALADRIAQFMDGGWTELPAEARPAR